MRITRRIGSADVILDSFIEALFGMMLDHHQAHVAEVDLTLVQAQALKVLRASPLSTSKLAATLGISAPAVTQLTDRLARKHLIERQAVKTDRRAVMVVTTEKGGRVIDEFRRRRNEVFAATLARLSEEDQLEVLSALSKFVSVLHGNEPARLTTLKEPPKGLDLQTDGRTAADSPEASKNQVGQAPVSLPTRRMRIEWD